MGKRGPGRGGAARDWLVIFLLLAALAALAAFVGWRWRQAQQGAAPTPASPTPTEDQIVYAGEPRTTQPLRILRNQAYVVGYSDRRKDPVWVAYRVLRAQPHPALPRPHGFEPDPRTGARVVDADYRDSGFDRGHMAPNSALAVCFGLEAQRETFLLSNICPQRHNLNAGTWETLEKLELNDYARRFGQVWVLDGPVFDPAPATLKDGVQVPRAFYKILIQEQTARPAVLAFIMPQDAPPHDPPSRYGATVRKIEGETGLHFLWKLPADVQDRVETTPARMW